MAHRFALPHPVPPAAGEDISSVGVSLNFGVEQIVNLLPETIKAAARTQEPKSIWSIGNSAG